MFRLEDDLHNAQSVAALPNIHKRNGSEAEATEEGLRRNLLFLGSGLEETTSLIPSPLAGKHAANGKYGSLPQIRRGRNHLAIRRSMLTSAKRRVESPGKAIRIEENAGGKRMPRRKALLKLVVKKAS